MNALLISAITAPAEALLNTVIAQDPAAAAKLIPLEGKTIRLECTAPLAWEVFIQVLDNRLCIRSVFEPQPDAAISANASAFSRLLLSSRQTDALFSPQISLSGDTHLIQTLHGILSALEIDWEEHFGKVCGDIPTYQLSKWLHGSKRWTQDVSAALLDDVEEYLHEEARILPGAAEVEHFNQRLDELKLAIDRIKARTERLCRELEKNLTAT